MTVNGRVKKPITMDRVYDGRNPLSLNSDRSLVKLYAVRLRPTNVSGSPTSRVSQYPTTRSRSTSSDNCLSTGAHALQYEHVV